MKLLDLAARPRWPRELNIPEV